MLSYTTADIRNLLIAGGAGSGKTTLVDAMLLASGIVTRKGCVTDGTSYSDFEREEKEHKHSIYAAVLHADHAGTRINLIDTPGSPDLIGQAIACLPAVETVAVVISAAAGIDIVTRRLMEAARERNLPRAIIINKIDLATDPDQLHALLIDIRTTFGSECLPINLPAANRTQLVECLLNKAGDSDLGPVATAHSAIIDQIVEMDEDLMESYLGGEEPNYDALHAPFERAMDEAHVVPVLFTDAKNNVGIAELLDSIARHFPSPEEGNLRPFLSYRGGDRAGSPQDEVPFDYWNDPTKPLLAHVFKVTNDPFVGKLAIFRVHQGRATGQSHVYIGYNKKSIKLGHVFHLQGKEHREANEIIAGDIGGVAKIEDIHLNDVLHDDHALDSVHLRPLTFPAPMFGLAITPKARGDEQKISTVLSRMAEEDPTFKWHTDRQTHEIVINGVGEMHLRFVLEKLTARGLHVDTKPPKIAYRETVSAPAEGHYRHKKQSGGAGQFAEVYLRVEPLPRGTGFEFIDETFGGSIPGQFIPAIEKGVREVIDQGVMAGYPVQDVRVVVTDGKHHPVDSKEIAFKTAGRMAFKEAFAKAHPVLLEPVVNMEVTVPETTVGAITGDLSSKRGRIHSTDVATGAMAVVSAQAPLGEVMQYGSQLKSVTGGRGSFAMELSHYDAVPSQVQQQVVSQYKPHVEEE
ncbi:MAG TPA: elongation factor G [Tepidisphaeraceae bacterium]|jgi:elongation factor G|nr:elongation factor G [Tepidisphaeraceae bacterium]